MIDTICNMKCYAFAKFYFSIHTFFQVGLLNHVNASLEECVERSTLQHTVLKQGESMSW